MLGNNPVVEKVGNLREDIRERWETTENPTVQRFQVSGRQHALCSFAFPALPNLLSVTYDVAYLV